MNRLYITLLCLFITPVLLRANDNPDYWHRGIVYLKSGEDLTALLQHDQKKDYVLVMQESGIKAYHASQIDSYEIFDPVFRIHRTFYPLPFPDNRQRGYHFFELLQEGELILLCREAERRQDQFIPDPVTPIPFHTAMIYRPNAHIIKVDQFFVLDKEGEIHWFNGSKKQLLALMTNQAGKIDAFIESQNLNLTNKEHLKTIFHYYDSLLRQKAKKHFESESPYLLTYVPDSPK